MFDRTPSLSHAIPFRAQTYRCHSVIFIRLYCVYRCTVAAVGDVVPCSNKNPFRLELWVIAILQFGHRLLNRLTRLRLQWNVYHKQVATIQNYYDLRMCSMDRSRQYMFHCYDYCATCCVKHLWQTCERFSCSQSHNTLTLILTLTLPVCPSLNPRVSTVADPGNGEPCEWRVGTLEDKA